VNRGLAVAGALTLGACKSQPVPRESAPAPQRERAAAPAAPADLELDDRAPSLPRRTIESRAQCSAALGAVAGPVHTMEVALDSQAARGRAIDRWQQVPDSCRTGRWYLLAARIQRWSPIPLDADDIHLAEPSAALRAALDEEPDREVLAYVAFVAGLGGEPALPADACARAAAVPVLNQPLDRMDQWADDLAYVCGHAALAAGDAATATTRFGAIKNRSRYPDLELRLAQAARAQGDAATAHALALQAATLDEVRARGFGATDRERTAIVDLAQQLAQAP
jgi:hypothetical protein